MWNSNAHRGFQDGSVIVQLSLGLEMNFFDICNGFLRANILFWDLGLLLVIS